MDHVIHLIAFLLNVVLGPGSIADVPPTIVVETWNIRYDNPADGPYAWPNRREDVVAHLRNGEAEILALQEVLPHQLASIRAGLPGYGIFARSRERDESKGEAVPILWRRDRWRLDEANATHFWLSETPEVPGSRSWSTACTRMVTVVRLLPVEAADDSASVRAPIWVANVHLDHRSADARLEGVRLLRARLAEMTATHPGEPVVVMGDFNATPESPPVAVLCHAGRDGFVEAWASIGTRSPDAPRGTWNGWDANAGSRRIDLVLVRGLAVEAADVLRPTNAAGPLSDHWPVRVVLSGADPVESLGDR